MTPGTRVRMSEELKRLYRGKCGEAGYHHGPIDSGDVDDCWNCSTAHIDEFGDCIGIVEGFATGPKGEKWPEVEVRWQPSKLRYAYDPKYLDVVK